MSSLTIESARDNLTQVIAEMIPGEEVELTENGKPVARLIRTQSGEWPCKAGSAKDRPHFMAPDFDAPLDDFQEYR